MGNSPSASAPAPAAPAPAAPAASPVAPAPAAPAAPANAPAASLATNSKKNNAKTVVQVPAENVTVTKGGKRRRLRGGVASVHFDLVPRLQPSDMVMDRVTSAPSGLRGGSRSRSGHRRRHSRSRSGHRRSHKKHGRR